LLRHLLIAALFAAASPAVANAATIGESDVPAPVRAYRDTVVWSAQLGASQTHTLTVYTGGRTTALPVTSDRPIEATVGRGPDGQPLIVYAACPDKRCGLYSIAADGSASRLLARTSSQRTPALAPAVWRDRLVWIEEPRGVTQVVTARIGERPSVIRRYRGVAVHEIALLGRKLALSVVTNHSWQEAQVWLQTLSDRTPRAIAKVTIGEAGRAFIGLSFSRGSLYFAKICSSDQGGCNGHGTAYRYRARHNANLGSFIPGVAA
jgi:hypothetical protein